LLIAALITLAALALMPAASPAGKPSGIKGVLLDATCYGPCAVNPDPKPYTGDSARLVVRSRPSGDVVARRSPADGRFRLRLPRGRYRVKGYVNDPCWQGEAKKIRVRKHRFRRVRLHVANTCIR
jgi:hypothetical protein